MRRRDFVKLVGGAAVAWPLAASAQVAGLTYRLGGLSAGARDAPYFVAMFENLRRLGFVEGQNLTVDWHTFALHVDRVSDFAAELVKTDVDVILASGDLATRAAQRATQSISILGTTDDMVRSGLVNSLARPEGNTTGISMFSTELDGKRQEILIEAVPGLRRMAAIADSISDRVAAASGTEGRCACTQRRAFDLSDHQSRGDRSGHRRGEGVGCRSAERFGITRPLRQSPNRHATRCGVAPAGHLSISGSDAGRRLCRLRPAPRLESWWSGSSSSSFVAPSPPMCRWSNRLSSSW